MSQEREAFYKELREYDEYKLNFDDNIVFNKIKSTKVNALPSNIYWDGVSLYDFSKNNLYLFQYTTILQKDNFEPIFYIYGEIVSDKWNTGFIYPIFQRKMKQILNEDKYDSVFCELDSMGYYFNIKTVIKKNRQSETIKTILEAYNEKVKLVYSLTLEEIARQNTLLGTVNLKFGFPKHLKALCKQYLSYFEKFLTDRDIDCELSLIDNQDITYMTINVDESKVDISELQKALAGYFSLPALSQENIILHSQDVATQQLIANIEHLKSQLRLANLTITQYENCSVVNTQRPIEYVLVDSLDDESKLKLFNGLIKVGKVIKLKFLGIDIEFDIPLLIDKVKLRQENED